jgi:AraC family transcriptional regulator
VTGSLSVAVVRAGETSRLSHVTCTLGARDRPFPEVHEPAFWTISLVRRGTFRYRSSGAHRLQTLRPGWLLIGAPERAFECSHDRDGGDDCASLAVSEEILQEVARAAGLAVDELLPRAPALPPSPRIAALLERARLRDTSDLDEAGYLITESLVAHASGTPTADPALPAAHVRRIHDAIDRIETACHAPLSLADLAAAADFSPFHFLRLFRRVTGTTPHRYLVGARLRLAARLLLDSHRPVTDIAYSVGFQDLSNFVRTFHRAIGASPRTFRAG